MRCLSPFLVGLLLYHGCQFEHPPSAFVARHATVLFFFTSHCGSPLPSPICPFDVKPPREAPRESSSRIDDVFHVILLCPELPQGLYF